MNVFQTIKLQIPAVYKSDIVHRESPLPLDLRFLKLFFSLRLMLDCMLFRLLGLWRPLVCGREEKEVVLVFGREALVRGRDAAVSTPGGGAGMPNMQQGHTGEPLASRHHMGDGLGTAAENMGASVTRRLARHMGDLEGVDSMKMGLSVEGRSHMGEEGDCGSGKSRRRVHFGAIVMDLCVKCLKL